MTYPIFSAPELIMSPPARRAFIRLECLRILALRQPGAMGIYQDASTLIAEARLLADFALEPEEAAAVNPA